MSQTYSKIEDDFHFVLLLSCFVGHSVATCLKDEKQQREFPSFLAPTVNVQGVPKNVGIQWRIRYRLCYQLALWIVIPNFKSQNIIMSARVYFMKRVKDMSNLMSHKMNSDLLYTAIFLYHLVQTTVCSQNINKQNVNIADKTLTNYSFLSRYHYTKS